MTAGIDFALYERGAITGTVREETTGEPLAEATVQVWDAGGQEIEGVYSDHAGRYRISDLAAPGSYVLAAYRRDFAAELYDDVPCSGDGCDPASGTPVAVAAGETAGDIDFALAQLAAISGKVKDAVTGEYLDWACVEVWDEGGSQVGSGCIDPLFSTSYIVGPLAAGTYFATASSGDYLDQLYDGLPCPEDCDPTAGTPITVEADATTTGVDFTLDRLGEMSGTVTDAVTGTAIESASIYVWRASGELADYDRAGHDGYVTEPLPPGTYFATARADYYFGELYQEMPCPEDCDPTTGTPITVAVNQTTAGIDFTLEPNPLGRLAGKVTDRLTGQPIPDVYIKISDAGGDRIGSPYTDAFGRFIVYVPAGTYFAYTGGGDDHHRQLFDDIPCDPDPSEACDPTAGTPIAVAAGHITPGIDFRLWPVGVASCDPAADLCLGDGDRFRLEIDWRDHQGTTGAGRGVELTRDSGYFWFFHQDNVEVVLKVLDACATPSEHFWVFAAGLTDVECALRVIDTWTGEVRTWDNPLATPFAPIQATRAFATCDATPPPGASSPAAITEQLEQWLRELDQRPLSIAREIEVSAPAAAGKNDCVAGDTVLCLNQDRFAAEVRWRTPAGRSGDGRAVPLTADTGTFWFFGADNVELVVKLLDGCAINQRFWVFAAGLTNVEVILTLTDTVSGAVREYVHPMGTPFPPIQDTGAFDTCP